MPNILDGCVEDVPLLTPALSKPKTITKAQIQNCISKLSPRWDDEQLEAVVSMFNEHGLLEGIHGQGSVEARKNSVCWALQRKLV